MNCLSRSHKRPFNNSNDYSFVRILKAAWFCGFAFYYLLFIERRPQSCCTIHVRDCVHPFWFYWIAAERARQWILWGNVQKFYLKIKYKFLWQQLHSTVDFGHGSLDSECICIRNASSINAWLYDANFILGIDWTNGQTGGKVGGATIEIWERQIIGFSLSALKTRQTV